MRLRPLDGFEIVMLLIFAVGVFVGLAIPPLIGFISQHVTLTFH